MNIALLLSGGNGSRVGVNIPKQYINVGGKMIITYSLEILISHEMINAIHVVTDMTWQEAILQEAAQYNINTSKISGFSEPGENRQLSIFNGLRDIKEYAEKDDLVLIHDAARPLLSKSQITDCFNAVYGHDGAMPVLPMKDTVYLSHNGVNVSGLLDRTSIFAGQAPEVFRLEKYYKANLDLLPERILSINGSTEPAILNGLDVVIIPGLEENFKITTRRDLERFQNIVLAQQKK